MTVYCRIFSFAGIKVPPGALPILSRDNLAWPAVERDFITADHTPQNTRPALTPEGVSLLLLQVERGKRVFVEVCARGQERAADLSSMIIEGEVIIQVGAGWTLSLLACEE